jgi:iron complex transport system substrate-binding protein
MNAKIERILGIIAIGALLVACSKPSSSEKYRTVTDMAGRTIQVPDTIRKVYTQNPGTVLLYMIDPGLLACRTMQFSKASIPYLKPEYKALPYTDGSVEEIIKNKPDVIISYFDINNKTKDDADQLSKKTGIPVFVVDINMLRFPEVFDTLGTLLNRRTQTDKMKSFYHKYVGQIISTAKKIPNDKKVRVYYAETENGTGTDPSGSKHSQIIDLVGATNVANVDALPGSGLSPVSMEQILLWNPDVILCWTGMSTMLTTYQHITKDKVWKSLKAVKNNKVYQIPYIPFGWFDRPPGPSRILGAIWTAKLLYPELYHFDIKSVTKEYFEIFYHTKITDKQLIEILNPSSKGLICNKKSVNEKKRKNGAPCL